MGNTTWGDIPGILAACAVVTFGLMWLRAKAYEAHMGEWLDRLALAWFGPQIVAVAVCLVLYVLFGWK